MGEPELEKEPEREERERILPLVVEVMPGRADLTIEERQVLEDIKRQLDGGKLLCRGNEIDVPAAEYASVGETEAGEKYVYVPIRAIKPQEGGVR